MTVRKLFWLMIAGWSLGAILQALGAESWIIYTCAIGMGLFWIEDKSVDKTTC